jgi:hypothetical protein
MPIGADRAPACICCDRRGLTVFLWQAGAPPDNNIGEQLLKRSI